MSKFLFRFTATMLLFQFPFMINDIHSLLWLFYTWLNAAGPELLAIEVCYGKILVYALVSIDERVDEAAVELWLDSQRTTSPAMESFTILSSWPNHNSTAASLTLVSMETNAYTQILPWHTSIANNSSPAVFDHVYKNQIKLCQIMIVTYQWNINDHE